MIHSIQICRGIAALLVVLCHLGVAIAAPQYFGEPFFSHLFAAGGRAGVDFFFVLSGFIITSVHWRDVGNPSKLPAYLFKRCARIYPVYWIVFAGAFTVALLLPGAPVEDMPRTLSAFLVSAALLPQDPSVVGATGAPLLTVAWTLQYEMLFYLFFGVLILGRGLALAAFASLAIWLAAGWLLALPVPLGFLQPAYFVLFAGGSAVGLATAAGRLTRAARPALFAGLVGFVATASLVSFQSAFPEAGPGLNELALTFAFGGASTLLIFGLVTLERQGWKPELPGALLLGDASYVLYLIHYPLLAVVCKVAVATGLRGAGGAALAWVAALATCIAVAIIFHLWIERPLLHASREFLQRRQVGSAAN
ncbi:MAG: exopolysaccharide production protein ExoZ [Hyphomicrobiaceae bacterium]|jgi:exopolysaccharide production protein ExoZ